MEVGLTPRTGGKTSFSRKGWKENNTVLLTDAFKMRYLKKNIYQNDGLLDKER